MTKFVFSPLRIAFAISLLFNILLYFWWIDLGQYKQWIDQVIQTTQNIATSQETQQFLSWAANQLSTLKDNPIISSVETKMKQQFNLSISEFLDKSKNKSFAEISTLLESKWFTKEEIIALLNSNKLQQ